MWNVWFFGAAAMATLVLSSCSSPTAPQSDGSMINNQGERVVIIKNPLSKSDAVFANEYGHLRRLFADTYERQGQCLRGLYAAL